MNRKALETIERYRMLSQGDRVVAGVSGGADSVALLHFLCAISEEYALTVTAAHLNHRLRGEESRRDEDFVCALCAQWGVPLSVRSADVAALARERGESVEEAARRARYGFFSELAAGAHAKVATAHTLTDSAETQLLNLLRGTGLKGLCGVPPVRGIYIRPLVGATRQDVEDYCRDNGLRYVTDSTNLSDDYTRNRLRHHVSPALLDIAPHWYRQAGAAMELLQEDEAYLQGQAAKELEHITRPLPKPVEAGSLCLDRAGLLALPGPLSGRILREALTARGLRYDRERIRRLLKRAALGAGGEQLSGQWYFTATGQHVLLERRRPPVPYFECGIRLPLQAEGICFPITGKCVHIKHQDCEEFEKYNKSKEKVLKNALDCDKIGEIVKLRQRLPADSFQPAGRGVTKSLKKLFSESGLSAYARSTTVVLAGEDGRIYWVEGFGAAEDVRVSGNTRRVLHLEILEEAYVGGSEGSTDQ